MRTAGVGRCWLSVSVSKALRLCCCLLCVLRLVTAAALAPESLAEAGPPESLVIPPPESLAETGPPENLDSLPCVAGGEGERRRERNDSDG